MSPEVAAFLRSIAEPEQIAPGLWRVRVADRAWQWYAVVNGIVILAVSTSPDWADEVRGVVAASGRLGAQLVQAGSVVWEQERAPGAGGDIVPCS